MSGASVRSLGAVASLRRKPVTGGSGAETSALLVLGGHGRGTFSGRCDCVRGVRHGNWGRGLAEVEGGAIPARVRVRRCPGFSIVALEPADALSSAAEPLLGLPGGARGWRAKPGAPIVAAKEIGGLPVRVGDDVCVEVFRGVGMENKEVGSLCRDKRGVEVESGEGVREEAVDVGVGRSRGRRASGRRVDAVRMRARGTTDCLSDAGGVGAASCFGRNGGSGLVGGGVGRVGEGSGCIRRWGDVVRGSAGTIWDRDGLGLVLGRGSVEFVLGFEGRGVSGLAKLGSSFESGSSARKGSENFGIEAEGDGAGATGITEVDAGGIISGGADGGEDGFEALDEVGDVVGRHADGKGLGEEEAFAPDTTEDADDLAYFILDRGVKNQDAATAESKSGKRMSSHISL